MSGYSGTPLAQKLGIRAGSRLYLLDPPQNYAQLVAPLPEGARTVLRLDEDTDIIHMFAVRRVALTGMRADATIWVSWPKKTSGVATDITEDAIRTIALPMMLVDIKVCAVNEVWSGLKLVIRKAARPKAAARPAPQKRGKG